MDSVVNLKIRQRDFWQSKLYIF